MQIYQHLIDKTKTISVTGLGYVGLPLALLFGPQVPRDRFRHQRAARGPDAQRPRPERGTATHRFADTDITFTSDPADLKRAHFHIVAVPTPVDGHRVPNLRPLEGASAYLGRQVKRGDYVVYESTVYPGCTEEDCLPILERESGLRLGTDFKIGYSPERINPGDKVHTVDKILKIVSGSDAEALEEIRLLYSSVVTAGVFAAESIKVAEAAKVIENSQRDLNISFVNELAIIFDRLDIDTQAVLDAAGTKWNFLRFTPGLVGGHCISVDPYYLLHKSKQLGYDPQVILSGRRVNDGMPAFIAKRLIQMLIARDRNPSGAKVLILGITFKEDVADIRNSKVVDLARELMDYSVNVHLADPHASPNEVAHEYKLTLVDRLSDDYDAVIVAVSHRRYRELTPDELTALCRPDSILMDLKALYDRTAFKDKMTVWRL